MNWEALISRPDVLIPSGAGLFFLLLSIFLAVVFPSPRDFQIFVFRTVLSLASSSFAAAIPGLLDVSVDLPGLTVRAVGALAVFLLVYFFNPARLPPSPIPDAPEPIPDAPDNNAIVISFNLQAEIKHIIKDVPDTPYPPYHDGRRIRPSSREPIYEFLMSAIQFPQNSTLNQLSISYRYQYYAETNYDPATMKFSVIYPRTSHTQQRIVTSSKSYTGPMKRWKEDVMVVHITRGGPPKSLSIYVTDSGDFEFMLRDMQVDAIFEQLPE